MTWTSVPTKTGVAISAADWNTYVAGNLNAGAPVRILDTVLSADQAGALDIQGIPQDFQHLQITMSLRSTQNVALSSAFVTLNGDAGTNYDGLYMQAVAAALNFSDQLGVARAQIANVPALTATSGVFGYGDLWIPNYSKTVGHKAMLAFWQSIYGTATTNHENGHFSFLWKSSSAVTSIQLTDSGIVGWAAGSRVVMRGWP